MIAVEGDAVQLHAMVDEAEAELLGDPLLQCFQLVVDELDHVAGFDVDQMVVMRFRRGFLPYQDLRVPRPRYGNSDRCI